MQVKDITLGLRYLHKRGIYHADLKPVRLDRYATLRLLITVLYTEQRSRELGRARSPMRLWPHESDPRNKRSYDDNVNTRHSTISQPGVTQCGRTQRYALFGK